MKNKKWIMYLVITVIILVTIIVGITFFYNKSNNKTANLGEKIKAELKFLDTSTIYIINSLNNLNGIDAMKVEKMGSNKSSGASNNTSGSNSQSDSSNKSSSQSTNNEESTSQSQSTESSETSEPSTDGRPNSSSSGTGDEESSTMQKYVIYDTPIMLRDRENINWSNIENKAEDLYSAWMSIAVDLTSENVSNENILAYNENLDNLITSIKKQDKNNSAICLANLYSLIPRYMEETSADKNKIQIEKVKSNVISAYAVVGNNEWDNISKMLAQAENDLINYMNSSSSSKETEQIKINKCYVLLKELIKTSNEKNADLFYLKYVNLMDEIVKI